MFISIDIGGTKTRIALSKDLNSVERVKRFYTNQSVFMQKQVISSTIGEMLHGGPLEFVCVGVPGVINRQFDQFGTFPNYKELNGQPYSALIDEKYLIPGKFHFDNDAALAAVGEAVLGAGKDCAKVGYLTFGTGTGGSLVTKDSSGLKYTLDEPGHVIIVENGRKEATCMHKGCFEAYTSGRAFNAIFGIKPQNCTDDSKWRQYAEFVSLGLKKLYERWHPDVYVIGGSMALEFELYGKYLECPVPVLRSVTLDDAGIYGGLVLTENLLSTIKTTSRGLKSL